MSADGNRGIIGYTVADNQFLAPVEYYDSSNNTITASELLLNVQHIFLDHVGDRVILNDGIHKATFKQTGHLPKDVLSSVISSDG